MLHKMLATSVCVLPCCSSQVVVLKKAEVPRDLRHVAVTSIEDSPLVPDRTFKELVAQVGVKQTPVEGTVACNMQNLDIDTTPACPKCASTKIEKTLEVVPGTDEFVAMARCAVHTHIMCHCCVSFHPSSLCLLVHLEEFGLCAL